MGISVFGVYELAPASTVFGALASATAKDTAVEPITKNDVEEYDGKAGVVVGYVKAPAVHAGDDGPLVGHVGDGAAAGLAQSVLMDAYELVLSGWRHRRTTGWSGVNAGVVARRAVRDSVGFAALFGTYEVARRFLEEALYGALRRSGSSLALLEKYRVVTRGGRDGAYDASPVSMGAAFVAGGVAGQGHLVVNHYTHSLFVHHPSASRRRHGANSVRNLWNAPPKPPKARMVAGAFLPSALCFLAFRYGGVLAERLVTDNVDGTESDISNERLRRHPTKLLPIYYSTPEPAI
jgi:hypothetical protein